jgi:hypothetical protein
MASAEPHWGFRAETTDEVIDEIITENRKAGWAYTWDEWGPLSIQPPTLLRLIELRADRWASRGSSPRGRSPRVAEDQTVMGPNRTGLPKPRSNRTKASECG